MENIIINYSEFINDDGGFNRLKVDFTALGDDLIKEAKRIKKEMNENLDLSDIGSVEQYEGAVSNLQNTFKDYAKARSDFGKLEKKFIESQQRATKSTAEQAKNLGELEFQLSQYKNELKKLSVEERKQGKVTKESAQQRSDLRLKIKELNKEINLNQKEVLESNKLSKNQEKILKAELTLQKDRADTIAEIRERLSALRIVASQVNISTEEGRATVAAYNAEIDELTDRLSDNSDQFIKNKINIGNYEESINNALNSTDLFKTNIGVLDNALGSILKVLTLNGQELEELNEKLKNGGSGLQRFAAGFGRLNKVLKASVIGAVLVAVAAIGSAFTQGRAGVVRTEKAFAVFGRTVDVIKNTLVDFGKGFVGIVSSITNGFASIALKGERALLRVQLGFQKINPLSTAEDIQELETRIASLNDEISTNGAEGVNKLSEGWNKLTESVTGFADRYKNATDSITTSSKAIEDAFRFGDLIRAARIELVQLNAEFEILNIQGGDSTISLNEQLEAQRKALAKNVEILEQENRINKLNLSLANAKARADLQAAGASAPGALRVANIKDEVEFAKELLRLNQQLAVTDNVLDDDLLQASQDSLLEYLEGLETRKVATEENAKLIREIERDLFEQNLDLLIDLIDTEKNASEQFVNDAGRNFQARITEFNRFIKVFQDNAQRELNEFSKFAEQTGKDLDFQIEFDDNGGFELLVNDTKLAVDNIVELNAQLQGLGLAEIPINRLREFIIEARNGVKDFKDLNKELNQVGIDVNELFENLQLDEQELRELESVNDRIRQLSEIAPGTISNGERQKVLEDLKSLEEEKAEIEKRFARERLENRLDAIGAELQTVEEGSKRELELLRERAAIQKDINNQVGEDIVKDTRTAQEKAIEAYEKFTKDAKKLLNQVLDQVLENNRDQIADQEKRISRQEEATERQRRRAELGLANTLAFEQKERAKQEAELIKREKRLERLEKIKALYSSYNNYASQGEQNALGRALRDFALLEVITASFGDGGIVGVDGVRTNSKGVTQGRSHNNKGGVLAYHEGGEGFLSRKEMANLGQDNFYNLKSMAGKGILDTNFFTGQAKDFSTVIVTKDQSRDLLLAEVKQMKLAIENKETSRVDLPALVDGVLHFTETVTSKNKVKRNHFKVKRPRI